MVLFLCSCYLPTFCAADTDTFALSVRWEIRMTELFVKVLLGGLDDKEQSQVKVFTRNTKHIDFSYNEINVLQLAT